MATWGQLAMAEPLRWRSLNAHCRELHWSKPRAIYELQNGLPFRTIPPGHEVDWRDAVVRRSLDLEASTVTLIRGVQEAAGERCFVLGLDSVTVGIEVLPPVEVPSPPADTPKATSTQWAIAATRKLRAENKIAEGAKKADLARLLAAESEKAVRAGQIDRRLKELALKPWQFPALPICPYPPGSSASRDWSPSGPELRLWRVLERARHAALAAAAGGQPCPLSGKPDIEPTSPNDRV